MQATVWGTSTFEIATRTDHKHVVEFEVVPDEIDGWDVKKGDEEQALSNHATRENAVHHMVDRND